MENNTCKQGISLFKVKMSSVKRKKNEKVKAHPIVINLRYPMKANDLKILTCEGEILKEL